MLSMPSLLAQAAEQAGWGRQSFLHRAHQSCAEPRSPPAEEGHLSAHRCGTDTDLKLSPVGKKLDSQARVEPEPPHCSLGCSLILKFENHLDSSPLQRGRQFAQSTGVSGLHCTDPCQNGALIYLLYRTFHIYF